MNKKNLKSLIQTKQKVISREIGYPSISSGKDGDFQVRRIAGQGIFLFYKWHSKWYSTRLTQYRPRNAEHKQIVRVPIGIKPVKQGDLSIDTDGKLKIKKNLKTTQILSVDSNGEADANTLHFKRVNSIDETSGTITAFADYSGTESGTVKATDVAHGLLTSDSITISSSTNFNATYTITKIDADNFYFTATWVSLADETGTWILNMGDNAAGNPEFLFENTGHVHLSLYNPTLDASDTYDSFISFARINPSTLYLSRWVVGYDTSTGNFNWSYRSVAGATKKSYIPETPSSTEGSNPKMKLSNLGQLTLTTISEVGSDTDKFLISDSGAIKYVTGTNLRSYIGAGTSSLAFDGSTANGVLTYKDADEATVESNLTYDGTTLTAIGTATTAQVKVDKNYAGTSSSTSRGMFVDYDHTGISGLGQTINNIGLDLDINSDSITHVGIVNNTGLDVDLVAGTSGTQTNVGIDVTVGSADTNYSIKATGGPIMLQEQGTSAFTDIAAYGQLWVKTATPNELWFTNDAGNDIPISLQPFVKTAQFQDDIGTTQHYIPFNNIAEQSTQGTENLGFIAPFNMTLQKVIFKCSEDISGATIEIGMWAVDDGDSTGHHHTTAQNNIDVTGGAAHTNAVADFTGTVGLAASGSGGSNAITAGQFVDLSIQADTDVTSSSAEFWITCYFLADLTATI